MASGLYDPARQAFLNADIDWTNDTIKAVLIDIQGGTGYTVDFANHVFLDDIPVAARIATSGALTGKTSTAGIADADDVIFLAPAAGTVCEAIALFVDTGSAATSRLICYIDSTGATGLPVTTNGANITIIFSNGANKIFKL